MPKIVVSKRPAHTLTRFQFINRFTLDEMVAIESAADNDPEVRVFLRLLDVAENVDLQNEKLVAGLNLLVSKGLITQERLKEILNE